MSLAWRSRAQKPLVFPSAERRQASELARLVRLGVSARTGAASGSQVGLVQLAQPESVGLDCAPVAMVGLVWCDRLARLALRRQCGSVSMDLDGCGRTERQRHQCVRPSRWMCRTAVPATVPYDHTRTGSFL